jgi:hypothetical protein
VLMNGRDPAFANIERAEFWSELAPTWLELEDRMEGAGGPRRELALGSPGQAMDRLELLPGQRVVDLGLRIGKDDAGAGGSGRARR